MKQKMLLIGMCFLAGYLNAWSHPSHPEGKENFHGLFQKLYESINVYQTGHTNPYYNRSGEERPVLVLYNETTGQRTRLTQSDTLKYLPKAEIVDFMLSTDPQKTGKDVGVFLQVTIRNKGNEMKTGVPFSGQDFFTLPDTLKTDRKGDLTYLRQQTNKAFRDYAQQTVLDFPYMRTKGVYNEQEQYWLDESPQAKEVRYLEIALQSNEPKRPMAGITTVYLKDEEKKQPEVEERNLYVLFRKIYEAAQIYTSGNTYFAGANQLNAFPLLLHYSSDQYEPLASYQLKNVHGKELRQFKMYINSDYGVTFGVRGFIFAKMDISKTAVQLDTLLSHKDKLPLFLPNTPHPEEKGKLLPWVQRIKEAFNTYNDEKGAQATNVYWDDSKQVLTDDELARIQPDEVEFIGIESGWQGDRLVGRIWLCSKDFQKKIDWKKVMERF